ncbi:NAD(P)-dependent oxidoreductase [uncultured Thiohalocapsa sp.]|uniref:NAD(P)-dependent oxidoreductase n=1 Tax=uncultured Thiohalocapsa sp. TaxID=768990 RepID=UPI0025F76991|nr:NAD(P)-binding oxidoreductase [uncultured Thiohalocapsa sp.]
MTILVVGGTGATGRLLLAELLSRGERVRAIVRSADALPDGLRRHTGLELAVASLLDLSDAALAERVAGCRAVASCLGHRMTLRGVFGPPRRLVTDAVRRLCRAIEAGDPSVPVRFVLMSSAGVAHRDLDEPRGARERLVLALLRALVPPHADNEQAAERLRTDIGPQHPRIEWVALRPDSLVDRDAVSPYDLHPAPTRSPLFDAGATSRINVAHCMAALITDDALWATWRGRMPVLYNRDAAAVPGTG